MKQSRPLAFLLTLLVLLGVLALIILENATPARLPQGKGAVELYSNQGGDDLRRTVVDAIAGARDSILLAVYNLSDGKVIKALKTKADEGVAVTVIVDAKASPDAKRALGPKVTTVRRSPPGLMHLKVIVIDGKQLWLGSANMSYDSLRVHGNLMVGMDNSAVAASVSHYLLSLPQAGPVLVPAKAPIRFEQEGQMGDLWFLPASKGALHDLLRVINSTQSTLKVAMFTWTHPALTSAVIDAHRRGVAVTVVIDSKQGQGAGAEVVHRLREAGVPTSLSRGNGLLHYKMLISDDTTLVIGSANWTRAAFSQNDDCFLILTPLTTAQQEYLRGVWRVIEHESAL